jgi:competence protein ComEC
MNNKIAVAFIILLVLLNILAWQEVFYLDSPHFLKVYFLSVGQGDSEFIQTPDGYKVLIDGGPDSTVLSKLSKLLPFWDKTIDIVVLTHPEKDHMTGVLDILQKYHVKYFLWTGVVKDDAENKQLSSLLKKSQDQQNGLLASLFRTNPTEIIIANSGDNIKVGSVNLHVLFPFNSLEGLNTDKSTNNTCIVNKLVYGKTSFIFTGDIDSKAEREIVGSGEDIRSDVLKVAHHGSKYSTSDSFLNSTKPELAIIEVGKNNYGHPTPEVLQRLQKFGINVFRTDINGDIEVASDGNKIKIIK